MREKLVDAELIKVRDESIDIAKGIGIILMIVGHCSFCFVDYPWVIRGIYSFHMPLFFIISGFFIKEGLSFQYKKELKRLILPYVVVSLFVILGQNIRSLFFEKSFDWDICIGALYGSGGPVFNWHIPQNTAMWFLLCLFFSRLLFMNVVLRCKESNRIWMVVLLMTIGYLCGKFFWLPFCLCPALVAVSFIYAGYRTKKNNYCRDELIVLLLLWISGACLSSFDLVTNHYPLLFISLFVAFSGSIVVIALAKRIEKIRYLSNILNYYGRYSLAILCVNNIEGQIVPWYKLYDLVHVHFLLGLLVVVTRVAFVGVLLYYCKKIALFRTVFIH